MILTFANPSGYHFLRSKRACLEEFLKTDNVELINPVHNDFESFVFVVVLVCFDERRTQKQIEAPNFYVLGALGLF